MLRSLLVSFLVPMLAARLLAQAAVLPEVPKIDGPWWRIASNPWLGDITTPTQQPVDFAIWQAADGTWQVISCIRGTLCGGATRVFHRWEGQQLTQTNWQPMGIAMQANPLLGETLGGLQAPHVFQHAGFYYMVYGDWTRICLARSVDGKVFTRVLNDSGQPDLFTGPYYNTRDPMMLRIGNLFHCYYMGSDPFAQYPSAIFVRTSADLRQWSQPMTVSAGGFPSLTLVDAECPFVVERSGSYYLFRNQLYGQGAFNTQYLSPNPHDFGVGTTRYEVSNLRVAAPEIVLYQGQYYIAALTPALDGIQVARFRWVRG
jgi:hypothetical protein